MTAIVKFGIPEALPKVRDAIEYRFPFSVVDSAFIDRPEEASRTTTHFIDVTVTGTQVACWGIQQSLLPKVLFEYGKRHVEHMILTGSLKTSDEVSLHTGNTETPCPYSPDRIPEPSGHRMEVIAPQIVESRASIPLERILTAGNKELPQSTLVAVRLGGLPGTITAEVQLPGQRSRRIYTDLRITDGVIYLPLVLAFLSHSKRDVHFVRDLADRLLQDGVLAWFDEKELKPGSAWKLEIDRAIEKSDFVLVFLSEESVKRTGYFQRELKYALEQHKLRPEGSRYIIPILIGDCEVPTSLRDIHWLRADEALWYERLLDALVT